MDTLTISYQNIKKALLSLKEALDDFADLETWYKNNPLNKDFDRCKRTYRDSLIQRFEFCTDLFWKYIKIYLEIIVLKTVDVHGPASVIKSACSANIISEDDGDMFIKMVKSRNLTSHIYKEETAELISSHIPSYYVLLIKYVDKLKPYLQ